MAQYAKGYKKVSSETVLLKIIVSIILSVLGVIAVVFIYDILTPSGSYTDFTHLETYEEVLSQTGENEVPLDNYLIYFYSATCTACSTIKADVLKLADQITDGGTIPIFFVDTAAATGDKDALLLEMNQSTLKTPTLVVVSGGDFYRAYEGTDDVLATLLEVKNATYDPFN